MNVDLSSKSQPAAPRLLAGFPFRAVLLATLPLLTAVAGQAQTAVLPSPPDKAEYVPARPTLTWSFSDTTLLSNGGFEDGTNGWVAGSAKVVTKVGVANPGEGTQALSGLLGLVSREFDLPAGFGGLRLSYQYNGLIKSPELSLQRLEPTGDPVALAGTAHWGGGSSGWRAYGADLSAYAGRRVRLTWTFPFTDGVPWGLDDVRLTPVPPETQFEVWLATNLVSQLAPVGRTTTPSWPLRFLPVNRRIYWRVDTIRDGQTDTGPIWQFNTGRFSAWSQLLVDPVPGLVCAQAPLLLGLQVADENGFASPNSSGNSARTVWPQVEALGEGVAPPPVVATELNPATQTAEFQNLTGGPLDLSGWMVDVLVGTTATNAIRVPIPAASTLAAGGLFQVQMRKSGVNRWPNLASSLNSGWSITHRAAVILRDAASNVVDCVFYAQSTGLINGISHPNQTRAVSGLHWRGAPVTNAQPTIPIPAGRSVQRAGSRDANSAADWVIAAATPMTANAGLVLPFERGIGRVAFSAPTAPIDTDREGYFALPVQFADQASNLVVYATAFLTARDRTGIKGQTTPFLLSEDLCLAVEFPPDLMESDGARPDGLRVRIPAALATNLPVRLRLPDAAVEGVVLPAEIVIPAGATEAAGDLEVTDNAALSGPRRLPLLADAAGFVPMQTSFVIGDDEATALSLELPASVTEGQPVEGILRLGRPADRPVTVGLIFSDPTRLQVAPTVLGETRKTFQPGQTTLHFALLATDNIFLDGPVRVAVRAGFANWVPAEAALQINDDETNTLTLSVLDPLVEGGSDTRLQIFLGGAVTNDVTLSVTAEPADRLRMFADPLVPAGQRGRIWILSPVDDALTNGLAQVVVRATAPGWLDGTVTVPVADNDPARFRIQLPPGPAVVGQQFTAVVLPETMDGWPLPRMGLLPLNCTLLSADNRVLGAWMEPPFVNSEGTQVPIIPTEAEGSARLRIESRGLVAESAPMPIWNIPGAFGLTGLAFDEARNRLVLVDPTDGLAVLDLATGARQPTVPPLGRPTQAVVADDGQTLYVGRLDGRELARVNLATLAVEATWPVGTTFDGSPFYLDHFLPLPGQPESLAVLRQTAEVTMELLVFDGTNSRPAVTLLDGQHSGSLRAGLEPGQVFAVLPDKLLEFKITPAGVEPVTQPRNLFLNSDRFARPGDSVASRGLVLDGQVELLDPVLPGRLGGNEPDFLRNALASDPHTGRLAWYNAWTDGVFRVFDPLTLREVWRVNRPGATGVQHVGQMVWAGPHRWAVVVHGELRLETDTVSDPAPATDLALSASVMARNPAVSTATVLLKVENRGPNPAPDTRLTFAFPEARPRGPNVMILTAISTNATPVTNGLGGRSYSVGAIAPGATVEVTAELRASLDGQLAASALVGSAAADPDPTNNRAVARADGLPPQVTLTVGPPAWDGQMRLEFNTVPGWNYYLESSSTVDGVREGLFGILGDGQPASTLDPAVEGETRFWRVLVSDP